MSDLINAPPSFVNANGEHVVFVDFTHARYQLDFDAKAAEATAHSKITFNVETEGLAAISMNQPITAASLDGHEVTLKDQDSCDKKASFKVLSKPVSPGPHVLTVKSRITKPGPYGYPIEWYPNRARLHCIFNMSDLQCDGGYLEAFLPSNYCFDHFRMSFSVTIKNSQVCHEVFSNGAISSSENGNWTVDFPSYYTSSCPWFHLGPADEYKQLKSEFRSSDDRQIKIRVYTKSKWRNDGLLLQPFVKKTKAILGDLDCAFGPFPHDSVTVFALRECGVSMEYAGATSSTFNDLRHELYHSYFGRNIMPVNGDAGWIDEAIATWGEEPCRDPRESEPRPGANMGRRSKYMRTTSREAYGIGFQFLTHLDYVLRERGGLNSFLKEFAKQKRHQSITAVEFQELVEHYYGASLQQLFEACVYSESSNPEETT